MSNKGPESFATDRTTEDTPLFETFPTDEKEAGDVEFNDGMEKFVTPSRITQENMHLFGDALPLAVSAAIAEGAILELELES